VSASGATAAQQVVPREVVDLERVAAWMDAQGLGAGPFERALLLSGGTQNVLLGLRRAGRDYVLRRPPPHLRRNSNETMRREARVLASLAGSDVPHPRLIAACPTEDVIGAAFYLMEPIHGYSPTRGLPEPFSRDPALRHAMGLSLVDGILALGRVDHVAVGLADFGKVEGYLERQVPRWRAQLESYSEFAGWPGPEIPGVERVAGWLEAQRPGGFTPGILHGDYHLANVMFRHDAPALAAIVDWELCTIGDPLLDLGGLLATWPPPEGPTPGTIGVTPWTGFPSAEELIAHYRRGTTRDLSALAWYRVLACYKLGIILEGTHARACAGKAPKQTGDALHATTVALFERALGLIAAA
jgi:aminoglycoside phosphotransferase (APT) family kinase protein